MTSITANVIHSTNNAFKSSFCISMFFDVHGLMNCYRTLTLREIHKLPKLGMFPRNAPKLGMCGVTYANVSRLFFLYRKILLQKIIEKQNIKNTKNTKTIYRNYSTTPPPPP